MLYIKKGRGQRGYGVGSAFVKFFRFVEPYAWSVTENLAPV
jgi:hypothetical protein